MAANSYTTTQLITSIRNKGNIPTSQTPFTDSDLLLLADDELDTALLRQLLSVRENYYLTYEDYEIADDGIYELPSRCIADAVANVQLLNGTTVTNIDRSEVSQQFATNESPSGFYSFFFMGSAINLQPNPTTGYVRIWYYLRPNTMVLTSEAAQVTVISGNTLTFDTIPTTITTGTPCDFIKDQPHFNTLSFDETPTVVTSTQITFASVPDDLVVGDWICLAGQTCVPQIPVEFRPLLVQRVVVKYNEIQGYLDKMKASQAKLDAMEKDLLQLINPRASGSPKRVVPNQNLTGGTWQWRAWRAT